MIDQKMSESECGAMMSRPKASAIVPFSHSPGKRGVRLRLHQLELDVCVICRRNPQGTRRSQIDRQRTLLLCAKQLYEHGVHHKLATNLNADNIRTLVDAWHAEMLTAATIHNRLVYLRWLTRKVGKPHIVAADRAYAVDRSRI